MPKETQTDPRKSFVTFLLPWLLGGVMLVVYWATLNHWITLSNLTQVAIASGWTWQPEILNPLMLLVTLPFRWLPAAQVPLALNVFSSLCSAATLVVLARTVAILPHDRTELERAREHSDFSFLTGRVAWIPPIAAIIFAGFQLGFWQSATSFSGESFDVLWFAVILWQLLEYRLDEKEGRLFIAAALYGAGMVDNWALLGFFPLFLTMIIWLRGLSFFDVTFIFRMFISGLAGFLLLMGVVVPLAAKFSGAYSAGVWESIRFNFTSDWQVIRFLKSSDIRHSLALMSLTSLLPAFIMSFKWSANFGDSSQVGKVFVNYAMHLVNAVILGILVWVTFDPPFSPARLLLGLNLHLAALPFYYVIAVCIGYYSGYFLLLFGKEPARTRRTSRPEPILPRSWMWLCPLILACELAALATGAGLLIYKNKLPIVAMTDNLLGKYGEFCTQKLPPEGAILLCDSDNPNGDLLLHGFAVEAALARQGLAQKYPIVDTFALHYSPYHRYLHHRYPQVWPNPSGTNAVSLFPPFRVLALLDQLSRSNDLCYLNPSFGYYFERFYQEPHGLVYQMKALPTDTLLPPRLSTNLIAENDAFWRQVMAGSGPAIRRAINPRDLAAQKGLIGWLIGHLHILPDANPNALAVGGYYSKSLDALGVQVQRAGDLERAAAFFTDAQELNSNNVVASVNLAFNKTLRMGSANTVELTRVTADQFGKYHSWEEVVGANGPFDEPSFCFGVGCWLFQSHLLNQATAAFDRVRQMAPDNLATRLFLAQIYVMNRQPELALQALHDPQQHPFRFALTESNSTELNEVTAAAYFQKGQLADGVALLNQEMNRHPDDERLLLTAAQTFNILGLHTNALDVINRKLSHTPNDPTWLFGKGLACLQSGAYDESVATLTRLLEIQTNYPIAVFDRGLANLQGGHLDAARADFLRVQAAYTNNFQIAYGLGEVAWKQHQTNEAIRNYTIYLAHSPTNSPEQKVVRERLSELGGK